MKTSRPARRAGLTLIELIVVLAILIAVGGIAVAVAPDILGRAHTAVSVTNIQAVESAIQQRRYTRNGEVGDDFDAVVLAAGTVAPYLPGQAAGLYAPYTLAAAADRLALQRIGVNDLVVAAAPPVNATFDAHDGLPVALSATTVVVTLDATHADFAANLLKFNLAPVPTSRYVLLGVGERCSLVGADGPIAEAPLHFSDTPTTRPDVAYSRYLALIELRGAGAAGASARFLGACVAHDDSIERAGGHLAEWHEQP